jgi:G:T-mismatch repair DNA endonuclease (very short patch repair protein)
VECPFDITASIKSNGKRVSKFQKKIFDETKLVHEDAILEHYLKDVCRSVDIFIPSKNLIVECYGDYWHCNPDIYKEDFYNKSLKMTAKETWNRDSIRISLLKSSGYEVNIIWENHDLN